MPDNSMNQADVVVERLRGDIKPFAFVVGRWVWVKFDSAPTKDVRDFLRAEGFHWNDKRECWQHCGGVRRRFSPHRDPLTAYSVRVLSDEAR